MKNKNNISNKNGKVIVLIGIIIILLLVVSYLTFSKKNYCTSLEIDKEKICKPKISWLIENCECVERNNIVCPEGMENDNERKLCVNATAVTLRVLKCSKYLCPSYFVNVNKSELTD